MCAKGKQAASDTIREAAAQTVREILNSPMTIPHITTLATEAALKTVTEKFSDFGGSRDAKSK